MKKILSFVIFISLMVSTAHAQAISINQLLGVWMTSPVEGVTLTYHFFKDNTFTWETESPENKMTMDGQFVIEQKNGKEYVVFSDFTSKEFEDMFIVTLIEFLNNDSFKMDGHSFTKDDIGEYPLEFTSETLVFQRVKTD
ncbi:MAG: hypothetical protein K8S27_12100 [Candidatus Omnitrophica bacterium]|nr:hypothetical protein [Candidatus Omnitrophota bacterium]